MALSIDELTRAMTEDEVFAKFLEIADSLGLPTSSWRKGGALRVIFRVVARVYAGFTAVMAAFIASGFLDTSTGEWLTKLAFYVYGVTRREATFAREKIRLSNTGALVFDDNGVGEIVVFNPATKKAYRNTEAFDLAAFEVKDVEFEAIEIGSASAAAVGTITGLETHLEGVTVSNPKPFIAIDAERDASLRQACRDKLASLSVRGPRGAYSWAVREAKRDDGNAVNVNRISVSTSSSTGRVTTTVAAPSGAPAAEDITAIADSIEQRARPDGVTSIVQGATEVAIVRALTVYAKRTVGVSAADIRSLVETAFVREGAEYPIGGLPKPPATQGKVWADWIVGVAKSAHPAIYEIDGDGSDDSLTTAQVPVFEITVAEVRFAEVSVPL